MSQPSREELVASGVMRPEALLWESGILPPGATPRWEHYVAYALARLQQASSDRWTLPETATGLQALLEKLNAKRVKKVSVAQQIAGRIDFGDVDWAAVCKILEEKKIPLDAVTALLQRWGVSGASASFAWKNPSLSWKRVLKGELPTLKSCYFGLQIEY